MAGTVLSATLGAIVMLGWYTHNVTLIQVSAVFVPMQFNTALCFMLTGAALFLFRYIANRPKSSVYTATLGSLIFGLACVALAGYTVGFESAYGWGKLTRMAVHTASGFLVLAVAVISLAWQQSISRSSRLPIWFPIPVGFGIVTITLSLWHAFKAEETLRMTQYGLPPSSYYLAESLLVIGIMLAVAFSLTVYLAQVAGIRRAEIATVNRRLSVEVDQHRRAREALQGSEERLRAIVDTANEAIITSDIEGKIVSWNTGAQAAFGYSADEIIGQPLTLIMPGRYHQAHQKGLRRVASEGRRNTVGRLIEANGLKQDGNEFPMEISMSEWKVANKQYVSAIIRDITKRRKMEKDLLQHQHQLEELVSERTTQLTEEQAKAIAANQAKSIFLANMSHEIRTPMNAIIGLTHLLQRASPTKEQAGQLSKIDSSAGHLLSIINDILDISKIEAGKLILESVDFHLDALFDHIQSLFGEQLKAKGLQLKIDRNEVPHWLRGDLTRLRQALINYVGNAVKFTRQGTIMIRAKKLQERDSSVLVRFEVQDEGMGIEPEKLSGLFEAFEQGDTSRTRKHEGTGLGLTITRHLAQLMGGEVGAESEPGKGSTFWFTARLERGHGVMPASDFSGSMDIETQLRTGYAGVRILLAEDNAINREVAVALLSGVALVVDTANDGAEAVAMVAERDYALVLMDVQMPVLRLLGAGRRYWHSAWRHGRAICHLLVSDQWRPVVLPARKTGGARDPGIPRHVTVWQ